MSESALIQKLFAPLALGTAGSYDLKDDAAFLSPSSHGLIVTQDQIIENQHFLPEDPLDLIARRLVRRNLSDMIAKGGVPTAAFLSIAWPKSRPRDGLAEFARGLGEDLSGLCGKCPLMGGDTSETKGGLVASLTLLGKPTAPHGQPVLRTGAQVGDVIAVTGVIGDAWLGLQARQGLFARQTLEACYAFSLAPGPPDLGLANLIGRYAHAAIDVSDGLAYDALQLARASNVHIHLNLDAIPLSEEAARWDQLGLGADRALALATGGDDYQPLIALSPHDFEAYQAAAKSLGVRVTHIGTCLAGEGLGLSFEDMTIALPPTLGWQI